MGRADFCHRNSIHGHFESRDSGLSIAIQRSKKGIRMVYPYRCCNCPTETEIIKGAREANRDEYCVNCGGLLIRVFTVPHATVKNPVPAWVSKARSDGQEIANVEDYKTKRKPVTHDYQPTETEMREIANAIA
jgi:predicted nucleic acid-binding Zn ribbon protein